MNNKIITAKKLIELGFQQSHAEGYRYDMHMKDGSIRDVISVNLQFDYIMCFRDYQWNPIAEIEKADMDILLKAIDLYKKLYVAEHQFDDFISSVKQN
jgi:hypothetical protein